MSPAEFEHWKQTRNPNEPAYPSTEGQHPFGEIDIVNSATGLSEKVKTQGSSTLKTALEEALRKVPDIKEYAVYRKLAEQFIRYLPDVPVYYVIARCNA